MKDQKRPGFITLPRASMMDNRDCQRCTSGKTKNVKLYIYCALEEVQRIRGHGHDKARANLCNTTALGFRRTRTEVHGINSYMLAMLFNDPITMDIHDQTKLQHDDSERKQ